MPGGHGGGGPILKTCPRCGRRSLDELADRLLVATGLAALPLLLIAFGAFGVTKGDGRPGFILIPPVAITVHLAVRLFAVARGSARRCDRCSFSWQVAVIPFLDEWQLARSSRVRLRAELEGQGLRGASSRELEGEVRGRRASVRFEDPPIDGRGWTRLAVACQGELGDARRLTWALEDVLPQRALVRDLSARDGELSFVTGTTALAARDVLAALGLLAGTAAALDAAHLNLVEHEAKRCAYCHAEGDALVRCASCGTALHDGCWSELGRCPTLGCGPASVRTPRAER